MSDAAAAQPEEEARPSSSSTTTNAPTKQSHHNKKKRSRADAAGEDDAYDTAYRGFTYTPVASTGRPGTPHRFFAESYAVQQDAAASDDAKNKDNTMMRVHRHANGLCVVTAEPPPPMSSEEEQEEVATADRSSSTNNNEDKIEFHVQAAPDMSLAQKRKRAGAMLRGKKSPLVDDGAVVPSDPLVTVSTTTATTRTRTYPAAVFGSVLELNRNLTVDVWRRDPLLKGYLAVILPTGPFPPSPPAAASDKTDRDTKNNTAEANKDATIQGTSNSEG